MSAKCPLPCRVVEGAVAEMWRKTHQDWGRGDDYQLCRFGFSFSISLTLTVLRHKLEMAMSLSQDHCAGKLRPDLRSHIVLA